MTPPTRKVRIANFRIPVFLSAPLLALTLSWVPGAAQASLPTEQARPTLSGLRLAQEPTVPTLRERVVQAGLDAIGTPYSWGGDDAEGFDCSGLVLYVYREIAGLELPRTARAQRSEGKSSPTSKNCVRATWSSSPPVAGASRRMWASTSARTSSSTRPGEAPRCASTR